MTTSKCVTHHICQCKAEEITSLKRRVKISGEVHDLQNLRNALEEQVKDLRGRLYKAEEILGLGD